MIKSTVKLVAGALTASGVIFNEKQNTIEILTAAHNILISEKQDLPPADGNWTQLANAFAGKLEIGYGPAGSQFNGAIGNDSKCDKENSTIEVVVPQIATNCGDDKQCFYDVAVITCKSNDLGAFARTFLGDNYNLKRDADYISKSGDVFLDKTKYMHLQLGYGLVTETRSKQSLVDELDNKDKPTGKKLVKLDAVVSKQSGMAANVMAAGNLHYRIAASKAKALDCFYDQIAKKDKEPDYTGNCSAFELTADAGSTSAPGDSGGPVYAVEFTKDDVYDQAGEKIVNRIFNFSGEAFLMGVTTGSDMETAKKPASQLFQNEIITSVIEYLKTRAV